MKSRFHDCRNCHKQVAVSNRTSFPRTRFLILFCWLVSWVDICDLSGAWSSACIVVAQTTKCCCTAQKNFVNFFEIGSLPTFGKSLWTRARMRFGEQEKTFDPKVWADADFPGTFGQEPSENLKAVKLRHGHVTTSGGVPLVWKLQLTSEICPSTTHAKCTGLPNSV